MPTSGSALKEDGRLNNWDISDVLAGKSTVPAISQEIADPLARCVSATALFSQEHEAMGAGTPGNDLAPVVGAPFATRLCRGMSRPHNWLQLVRFAAVGGSGYVVNLCVFAAGLHVLCIDYRISAVIAFIVAVCNNFWLNRHRTFGAQHGHVRVQALRFFAVSLVTFGFTYMLLIALVDGAGLPKVPAQAIAIAFGTPLSFVGQSSGASGPSRLAGTSVIFGSCQLQGMSCRVAPPFLEGASCRALGRLCDARPSGGAITLPVAQILPQCPFERPSGSS